MNTMSGKEAVDIAGKLPPLFVFKRIIHLALKVSNGGFYYFLWVHFLDFLNSRS